MQSDREKEECRLYLSNWGGEFSSIQMRGMSQSTSIAERAAWEAYSYRVSPRERKEIRKIIFEHFDYIVEQWNEFQERKQ